MRKEKKAITLHVLPTPPLGGVQNIQQGSFQFSPSHPSSIVITSSTFPRFHCMVLPFSWHSIVATKISSWTQPSEYETISKFILKVCLHYILATCLGCINFFPLFVQMNPSGKVQLIIIVNVLRNLLLPLVSKNPNDIRAWN